VVRARRTIGFACAVAVVAALGAAGSARLHLVDANIAQADLVKVLRRQIRAYAKR
jgi:hypothetical protein